MITLLVLMLEEQPPVREPETHRGEREWHGKMESRLEASQPSVCPSSVFNDPQHLTRAVLPLTHTLTVAHTPNDLRYSSFDHSLSSTV